MATWGWCHTTAEVVKPERRVARDNNKDVAPLDSGRDLKADVVMIDGPRPPPGVFPSEISFTHPSLVDQYCEIAFHDLC